jgi:hypothetical protein
VEVDEAYIGGKREDSAGFGTEGKTLVIVAVESEHGQKLGRVRFRCIQTITQEAAESFIADFVEPGSKVATDGLNGYDGYNGLNALGYIHKRNLVSMGGDEALATIDHVHLVISFLK